MVAHSDVPQLETWTPAAGFQLPSGNCQEESSFHARSAAGSPASASAAYAVGSSHDDFPAKYPQPPSEFWVFLRTASREPR